MNSKAAEVKKQPRIKPIGDRALDAVMKFERKYKNNPKMLAELKELINLQGDWQWTIIRNILNDLGKKMNLVFDGVRPKVNKSRRGQNAGKRSSTST